jgi:hypothetical protein
MEEDVDPPVDCAKKKPRRSQEGTSISKQRQHFSKQFYVQCPGNTREKKLQKDDDGFAPLMASSNRCWAGIWMEP